MTILQLEHFQYLSRTLHMAHTAEHFYVSPPAIAASIKRLEGELSTTLFENQGRSLILTESGKIFSKYVDEILSSLSIAKAEISSNKQYRSASLSIGTASPILWSELIESFMQSFPDIKINNSLVKVEQLRDPGVDQQFDFIFCPSSDFTHPSFEATTLPSNNTPCLAVYKNHPFYGRKQISLREAQNERFIALSRGYSFRDYFDTLCSLANFTPNIVLECDFQIRGAMLAAEYGILVTTKAVAERDALGDAYYIDIIDPQLNRTLLFASNKKSRDKEAAGFFFQYVLHYYGLDNKEHKKISSKT